METSGFSEEQLTIRESIFKICEAFPDVCFLDYVVVTHAIDLVLGVLGREGRKVRVSS